MSSILERNRNPVNGKPVVPSLETIKVGCTSDRALDITTDIIAMLDVNQPVQVSPSIPAGFATAAEKATASLAWGRSPAATPILAEENVDGLR